MLKQYPYRSLETQYPTIQDTHTLSTSYRYRYRTLRIEIEYRQGRKLGGGCVHTELGGGPCPPPPLNWFVLQNTYSHSTTTPFRASMSLHPSIYLKDQPTYLSANPSICTPTLLPSLPFVQSVFFVLFFLMFIHPFQIVPRQLFVFFQCKFEVRQFFL